MTLTTKIRRQVSTDLAPFGAQDELHSDLPNVLKNMLRELASRSEAPAAIELSEHKIREVCRQNDMGSYSLRIDGRLTAELSDFPYEGRYETNLDIENLGTIVDDPSCSYPAVELSQVYFEYCNEYEVQPDSNGRARSIRVLVMAVNHDSVLIYDPLRYAEIDTEDGIESTEIAKQPFVDAWEGRLETTSSLWVEETEQQRISDFP